MDNMKNVLLIGAGPMAVEYMKVLSALQIPTTVIGRSAASAATFQEKTGIAPHTGGLNQYLKANPLTTYTHAIVATGVEQLHDNTTQLVNAGLRVILVEKPGGVNSQQIRQLAQLTEQHKADIQLAYNRRHYASMALARQMIEEDGGLLSFHFEFTEWADRIAPLVKAPGVKENWFLANSTHVVDMAFNIGGTPMEVASFSNGDNGWHRPTNYSGAGRCANNVLFTYQANWDGPGRWGVEFITRQRRIILRPLEEVHFVLRNQVVVQKAELGTDDDALFKPGLLRQVKAFLNNDRKLVCTIHDQVARISLLEQMLDREL